MTDIPRPAQTLLRFISRTETGDGCGDRDKRQLVLGRQLYLRLHCNKHMEARRAFDVVKQNNYGDINV